MKHALPLIVVVTLIAAVGCQKKAADSSQVRSDVTDITPIAAAPAPAYTPTASDLPAATYTPSYIPAPAPIESAPAAKSAGYTIRKGDTLYSLARTHYGDGKAWQKIASANPGVDPHKLRVGQTIVIP